MALLTHTQKSMISSVFVFIMLVFTIVAYNVFWTNIGSETGNIRVFLWYARNCGNGIACSDECFSCLCGSTDIGNSTLAMVSLALIFMVAGWLCAYKRDIYSTKDTFSRLSVIFMCLAALFYGLASIIWGVTCHENVVARFGDSSSDPSFGPGYILSILCSVFAILQAIYYGRVTGLCGGGPGTKADPSIA